jgi:hypothetical protein
MSRKSFFGKKPDIIAGAAADLKDMYVGALLPGGRFHDNGYQVRKRPFVDLIALGINVFFPINR